MVSVEHSADDGAPVPEALKGVDLGDELDLAVTDVGEHRVGFEVSAWSQLSNAAVASEEVLDGYGGVVPDPVATHGIVAPRWFAVRELDLEHRAATIDGSATGLRRIRPGSRARFPPHAVVAVGCVLRDQQYVRNQRRSRRARGAGRALQTGEALSASSGRGCDRRTARLASGAEPRGAGRRDRGSEAVNVQEFRRIASNAYGGPWNQIQINVYLRDGPAAVPALARTIRHLLHGPSSEVGRLDDLLEVSAWEVRGFGEALAVKCLAMVTRTDGSRCSCTRGRTASEP
jgi:hypothetical protein